MIRFFGFILQIVLLAVVALWLADSPGTAHIVWHDTVIETSAAFLALCVLFIAFCFYLLFRLWHLLRHGPTHWRLRRKLNKIRKGQDQLTQGLIAIASGNSSEAGRMAVAARKNSDNEVAALWLQAQAAQLAGDHRAAREIFRQLVAHDDAAILGYRGLITEAKHQGNWAEMDRLLTELQRVKPTLPWLSLMRMESAARKRHWQEAESALAHAVSSRMMDSEKGRKTRAALRVAVSRAAAIDGNNDLALQAAEQAARQAPDWLPALLNLAETLTAQSHNRAALRTIERTWKLHPHPLLSKLMRQLFSTPLENFRQIEKLARQNESAVESRVALAEAALAADIWGEARRYLTLTVSEGTATQGVYRLLARLERKERGDERSASSWLTRAAEAPADPTWVCTSCGGSHEEWQPVCPHCNGFNTLSWQRLGASRILLAEREG